ncbi:polysaccharide pyruvyl transferase family protein [Patescibacteria group bacterium]
MIISLVGWFGSGNFGDEMILVSELELLAKGNSFKVFSFNPKLTKKAVKKFKDKVKIVKLGQKLEFWKTDFKAVFQALKSSDLVLIGGGGMLQDAYNWYTAPFFGLFIFLAKVLGKRVGFFLVGAGPLNLKLTKKLVRLSCRQADFIITRDKYSKNQLVGLGIEKKKVQIGCDSVLGVKSLGKKKELVIKKSYFVICLREVAQWQKLDDSKLAAVFDDIAEKHQLLPVFLPLSSYTNQIIGQTSEPLDKEASETVRQLMQKPSRLIKPVSLAQVQQIIKKADALVGMRLHALVMSANLLVPFLALSYKNDLKLKIFSQVMGLRANHAFIEKLGKNELQKSFNQIYRHKDQVVEQLRVRKRILVAGLTKNIKEVLNNQDNKRLSICLWSNYLLTGLIATIWLGIKSIIFRDRVFYAKQ